MEYYNTLGNHWVISVPILKYNNKYRLKANEIDNFNGVIIKTIVNQYLGIQVDSSTENIENIKIMIQVVEGIPTNLQRLIFNDHQLLGGTLSNYNIKSGDVINLILRLRGGNPSRLCIYRLRNFADVSNEENETILKLTKNGSIGRVVDNGINIEIKCTCTNSYRVISHIGYRTYSLAHIKVKCPLCYNINVTLETVGFVYCEYQIQGKKLDGKQQYMMIYIIFFLHIKVVLLYGPVLSFNQENYYMMMLVPFVWKR